MAYIAILTTYTTVIFTTVKSSAVQVMLLQKFWKKRFSFCSLMHFQFRRGPFTWAVKTVRFWIFDEIWISVRLDWAFLFVCFRKLFSATINPCISKLLCFVTVNQLYLSPTYAGDQGGQPVHSGPLTVVHFTNICGAKNRGAFAQIIFLWFCSNGIWRKCAKIRHSVQKL